MSTATDTRSGAPASSARLVDGVSDLRRGVRHRRADHLRDLRNAEWPLFTYHPGTNRVDWLFAPPVRDQGPAMHYYGWTANMLIGSAMLGVLATFCRKG